MYLVLFVFITLFAHSFELPNGVDIHVKDEYSDWFDVFYRPSTLISLHTFGGKTYYIGSYFRATFVQANLFCKLMHMHLITIPTKEETAGLDIILNQTNITGEFWTSGTRLLDGQSWIWLSSARLVKYENWGPGQPNNDKDHCIILTKTEKVNVWNDKNCNCRFFFICEKSLDEISMYVSNRKHESEIRKYYRTYFD